MKPQPASLWYTEVGTPHELHQFAVSSVLFSGRTQFQEIAILDTREYGKMVVIDDRTQSAEEDEYIYHESLVHPGMIAHPAPRKVLVIGGGEGATLREALRHPTVDRVVMVDIDREVVEQCQKLLPEWHQGSFQDPRVELIFADGKDFVARGRERFDVVVVDVCDALEEGPALALYTDDFYRAVKGRLTGTGLLVVQGMELSGLDCADHVTVHWTLRRVFRHVSSYATFVPSFWSSWGFVAASDSVDLSGLAAARIDAALRERGLTDSLRHYDGLTHQHMFALPKDVRTALAAGGPTVQPAE